MTSAVAGDACVAWRGSLEVADLDDGEEGRRRGEGYDDDDDDSTTTMTTLPSLHTVGRQAPTLSKRNNQHVKPAVAMILRKRDGRR